MRYVALGDSYTIGTSIEEPDRWPDLLVERLAADGVALDLVANLGVNGYTSRDLIERELPQLDALEPQLVTVLIGVNDVVQGVETATYRANVERILDALLEGLPPERIVAVETPDYTRTPAGSDYGNPERQRAGIVAVNDLLRTAAESRDIRFVEGIFEISQGAATDPALVASDSLHPSGVQYRAWVDRIAPVVAELLE